MVGLKCPVRRPRSVRTEFRGNEVTICTWLSRNRDGHGRPRRIGSPTVDDGYVAVARGENPPNLPVCAQGVAVPEDEERDFAEAD